MNETFFYIFLIVSAAITVKSNCKIDTTDPAGEMLANVSEMKDVKCNSIYLSMLKLKTDFRKIRRHLVT